jgi:hypothetical protein
MWSSALLSIVCVSVGCDNHVYHGISHAQVINTVGRWLGRQNHSISSSMLNDY